jgi:CheY-like chemotaxis protein
MAVCWRTGEECVENEQTILVVDDDAAIRDFVAIALEEEGYAVITAASGEEGLAALHEHRPALVILDMRMPVMDGWEFAERLRAQYGDRVPLLVMTAAVDAARRAAEVRAAGTLSKPFDLADLTEAVDRLLKAGKQAASPDT